MCTDPERQVCLVTGATSGIGLATAEMLAGAGAHVIVAGRNKHRAEKAAARVARSADPTRVEVAVADLASQDDIRRLASEVTARHDRLDVLINNAGTIKRRRELSPDGIEVTWAVNCLAPFLLTSLLLELLTSSGSARVVNVASNSHLRATLDFDDLLFERRPYRMLEAYGQSKLALVMLTVEQSRRFRDHGISAHAVHPGFIGSGFGLQSGGSGALLWRIMLPFLASPREGARTSVYLATSSEAASLSGRYVTNCRAVGYNPLVDDIQTRLRMWGIAEQMTGLAPASRS